MQVLLHPVLFAVLSVVLALHADGRAAQIQTAVTLWQFGENRLFPGQSTLPMQPLTTATDGSVTAYLYQVVNDVELTTTNAAGVTTLTIPTMDSRTIFASASGWSEHFGSLHGGFGCSLVDSNFGMCIHINSDGTTTNSGTPITEVVKIADPSSTPLPLPPSSLSSDSLPLPLSSSQIASSSFLPFPPATSSPNSKHLKLVGPIVGAVVGMLAVLLGGSFAFIFLRRQRQRQMWEDAEITPRAYDVGGVERNSLAENSVFLSSPQVELGRGFGTLKRVDRVRETAPAAAVSSDAGSPTSSNDAGASRAVPFQVASEIPTSELLQLLAQRVQTEERAPPYAG
ncbi:hypothetical protein B0H16DRAFT_642997 [Mycena metata]|uniref:Mid2 domain-containing protein n=1 Tax=Mycena metata TaxID=1033252 RepID=A0AAD7NFF7_9AGAR|nr:hypothetical protein B0H16DRAFT_642997 [Mycena metata]